MCVSRWCIAFAKRLLHLGVPHRRRPQFRQLDARLQPLLRDALFGLPRRLQDARPPRRWLAPPNVSRPCHFSDFPEIDAATSTPTWFMPTIGGGSRRRHAPCTV